MRHVSFIGDPAFQPKALGLILENAFLSLADPARAHYPAWMVLLLLTAEFDSGAKIGRYQGPLLMIHGDADETVPFDSGRALFEAAREPKRFVTVPGGTHNAPRSQLALAALDAFLDELEVSE